MKKTYIVLFGLLVTISLPQNLVAAAALEDVEEQKELWEQEQLAQRQQAARAVMQNLTPEQEELGKRLLTATRKSDVKQVENLINQGAPLNFHAPYNNNMTALCLAIDRYIGVHQSPENTMKQQIINILVTAGADVNHADINGWTPLMYSTYQRHHINIIHLLLKAGARASINQQAIVQFSGLTALMHAVDDPDTIRLLLEANASIDIDLQDHNGNTALLKAIRRDCKKTIRLLIFAGSRLDIQNNNGKTIWTQDICMSLPPMREPINLVITEAIQEKNRSQNLPTNLKQQLSLPVPLIDLILDYDQDPILRTQQLLHQRQQPQKKTQIRETRCSKCSKCAIL